MTTALDPSAVPSGGLSGGRSGGLSGGSVADPSIRLRLGLPKGRMEESVRALLAEAGVSIRTGARAYRPRIGLEGVEAKILKARAVVEMLAAGSRDAGFAGADWVRELGADLVCVLDLELDPVRLVVAAPRGFVATDGRLDLERLAGLGRPVRVASEYVSIARSWIEAVGLDALGGREGTATVVRSFGATEVLPPEDADLVLDNTATGATLQANGLEIVDEVMRSSTRLYASREAMDDPGRRDRIEHLALLLRSVLDARARVMLEVNVAAEALEPVIAALPAMHEPTVSVLHGEAGFAVKAAVERKDLAALIPQVKAAGGFDLVVSPVSQIVP